MVTNIKSFVPITLDLEDGQYTLWVELLQFILLQDKEKDKGKEPAAPTVSWDRLDVVVKQWIYGTISNNLLHTIIKPKAAAREAWEAIANLFRDNQASRALILKNRLINTKLESFLSVSAYFQELKVLSDQLANLNAPMSDADLVLQLVTGLTNTEYDAIGMFISQTEPLPTFFNARSRLTMEEGRRAGQPPVGSAFQTQVAPTNSPQSRESYGRGSTDHSYDNRGYNDSSQCGRSRGRGGRGRGRSSS
ncbi:uncharacterized protein LOC143556360 [Bidens hawaiensis]|uniref:uncharacterized protein LOC143556360 n=1 Tax=Bidens hawaiensis TaxID=980011 RepID=UPI0040492AB0